MLAGALGRFRTLCTPLLVLHGCELDLTVVGAGLRDVGAVNTLLFRVLVELCRFSLVFAPPWRNPRVHFSAKSWVFGVVCDDCREGTRLSCRYKKRWRAP